MPLPRLRLPVPPAIPLPSADELTRRQIVFEPVTSGPGGPVRLRHQGHAAGIFLRPAAAAHIISKVLPLVILALLLWPARLPANTLPPALRAIAVVEDWRGRRGALGEIGPYQMLPATWARYHGTAEQRALQHHAWLCRELARRGVDPSPFNLALCWNAGIHASVCGQAPVSSYVYARRVVAVMEAMR